MILTVCPNPCIDCTIELEKFNVGRLNRIENKIEHCAGKALNAAIGVARLDGDVQATGFMFETGGRRFVQYLANEGVSSSFVWSRGRVRVNYKIIDSKSMMTEINDRGDKISVDRQNSLLKRIAELSKNASSCVISGSLPSNVEDDYYAKMVASVNDGVKVFIDCEKEKLMHAVAQGVFLIKPNIEELQSTFGEVYQTKKDMLVGCRKLIDRGAKYVLLSLGKEGAILTDGTNSYYGRTGNVAVNSTVGAGDAMLGAAALYFEKGASPEDVLCAGVSAGTASVTASSTILFSKDKFDEIYTKVSIMKI